MNHKFVASFLFSSILRAANPARREKSTRGALAWLTKTFLNILILFSKEENNAEEKQQKKKKSY